MLFDRASKTAVSAGSERTNLTATCLWWGGVGSSCQIGVFCAVARLRSQASAGAAANSLLKPPRFPSSGSDHGLVVPPAIWIHRQAPVVHAHIRSCHVPANR